MCVTLLYALLHVYRGKEADAKAFQAEITRIRDQHRLELDTLMQRHVGKAETWVDKGHAAGERLNAVLGEIERNLRESKTRRG